MLATSAAEAPVFAKRSRMCSGFPAPPEATTGTSTAFATMSVISSSYPSRVPSASMLLTTISPAPSSTARRAHSRASSPSRWRPPLVTTS